jgi:hypothetical protein
MAMFASVGVEWCAYHPQTHQPRTNITSLLLSDPVHMMYANPRTVVLSMALTPALAEAGSALGAYFDEIDEHSGPGAGFDDETVRKSAAVSVHHIHMYMYMYTEHVHVLVATSEFHICAQCCPH